MLVPADMIGPQSKLLFQVNKFYGERVANRKLAINKVIREICKVVQDVLKEVEVQEPRFISSLTDINGRYDGLDVISPSEFEVVLYLNQMGVFNFVDDGSLPGCAVLKLSDGRKRSMSLWVEFITASGYLSARKIRSRFQTLSVYRDILKMVSDTSEVKLRIRERWVVQITPAFKCSGVWPRSAAHWPLPGISWPHPSLVAEVKTEGFDLLSKECWLSRASSLPWKETPGEPAPCGWLKAALPLHHQDPARPALGCEKHPREADWEEASLGDRINGILLQLISCLQSKRCPHYFLPALNLFKGRSPTALENAAKQTWRLTRELLINSRALENFKASGFRFNTIHSACVIYIYLYNSIAIVKHIKIQVEYNSTP
ncbi:Protein mab21like [Caligus rogercresseyi]|uniref:Protein mab21like n=1 Tax=Caligus rogercresseyi TaxID=217165 RepID=A0A7T8GUG7_CALRO|nr:Protein mab21like [Caligus rogercresseyi]